jgi:hypothetical protein
MVQPSSLLNQGIGVVRAGNIKLFRFSPILQARSDELLERRKSGSLTPGEEAELAGISDLSRIFTFINAQLAADAKWCPTHLEDMYEKEPDISVSTVTPPNI